MVDFTKPEYTYRVIKIDYIVDGDTLDAVIDLGFNLHILKRIRFKKVDTFEPRGGTEETRRRARAATERLKELLDKGGQIYLQSYKDETGSFGRLLGDLFVEESENTLVDVSQTLTEEGYNTDNLQGEILNENIQYIKL